VSVASPLSEEIQPSEDGASVNLEKNLLSHKSFAIRPLQYFCRLAAGLGANQKRVQISATRDAGPTAIFYRRQNLTICYLKQMPIFTKPKRLSIEVHQGFFMITSPAFEMANTKTAAEEHAMPEAPEIAALNENVRVIRWWNSGEPRFSL